MKRIVTPSGSSRPGSPLGPVTLLAGGVGMVLMAVLALLTLGFALLLLRGRGARMFRFGGPAGRVPEGAPSPVGDSGEVLGAEPSSSARAASAYAHEPNETRRDRGRSYAEVLEVLPIVLLA